MIKKISVYRATGQNPYKNIALEKFLLEAVRPGECILYLWQNQNTVVIGRNQNAWAECRTSLLESEGGHLARRLSGGGAVFHDLGNLNFTFIMPEEDYDLDRQLSVIQAACALAGIETEKSGRNDLLAGGMKFSGNAFYHSQGKAYHHGTLLISADMDKLSRYLTPSKTKLAAKGVASVRSRVVNLNTLCPGLTCELIAQYMIEAFQSVYGFTPSALPQPDAERIGQDAKTLSSWQWLFGENLQADFSWEDRFSWGGILLEVQVVSGLIDGVRVYSDAMDWHLPSQIENTLRGCRFRKDAMISALEGVKNDPIILRDLQNLINTQDF